MPRLGDTIAHLAREIEGLKRRNRGRVREGRVVEADAANGLYRVDVGRGDNTFLTPWIKAETISSGALKMQAEPTVGQHVKVTSENGEMTDALISASDFDDGSPRPHGANGEFRATVGAVSITWTADTITMVAGPSTIVMDGAGIRATAPKIDLN